MTTSEEIRVYRDLKEAHAGKARRIREMLSDAGAVMVNLIGSPGCGKTALIEAAVKRLNGQLKVAVLEGDPETTRDAERVHALGVPVSQIITGRGCHLDAGMVMRALEDLSLPDLDLMIIENVGNLLCPAGFDLGETAKIAVLSVTEGEDKPAKYPLLFREAQAIVITKTDILPYVPFDMDACIADIQALNPGIRIFQVSALRGDGIDDWIGWLLSLSNTVPQGTI